MDEVEEAQKNGTEKRLGADRDGCLFVQNSDFFVCQVSVQYCTASPAFLMLSPWPPGPRPGSPRWSISTGAKVAEATSMDGQLLALSLHPGASRLQSLSQPLATTGKFSATTPNGCVGFDSWNPLAPDYLVMRGCSLLALIPGNNIRVVDEETPGEAGTLSRSKITGYRHRIH